MNSSACASRAARSISCCVALGLAKAMFSPTVAEKRKGSWRTTPTSRRSVEAKVAHVDAVDRDAPGRHVVEARDEAASVVLPEPVWLIRATVLPGSSSRSMPSSTGTAVGVLERDVLEADAARPGGEPVGSRAVGDVLDLVEHLENPLARCGRPLRLADPHSEHPQRHHEHHDEEVEEEEVRQAQLAVDHHAPADEDHAACATSGRNDSTGTYVARCGSRPCCD